MPDNSVCIIQDPNGLDIKDNIHDQSTFFPDILVPGLVRNSYKLIYLVSGLGIWNEVSLFLFFHLFTVLFDEMNGFYSY